jgi:hypothetical protein
MCVQDTHIRRKYKTMVKLWTLFPAPDCKKELWYLQCGHFYNFILRTIDPQHYELKLNCNIKHSL